jgi:hypothetical protein
MAGKFPGASPSPLSPLTGPHTHGGPIRISALSVLLTVGRDQPSVHFFELAHDTPDERRGTSVPGRGRQHRTSRPRAVAPASRQPPPAPDDRLAPFRTLRPRQRHPQAGDRHHHPSRAVIAEQQSGGTQEWATPAARRAGPRSRPWRPRRYYWEAHRARADEISGSAPLNYL